MAAKVILSCGLSYATIYPQGIRPSKYQSINPSIHPIIRPTGSERAKDACLLPYRPLDCQKLWLLRTGNTIPPLIKYGKLFRQYPSTISSGRAINILIYKHVNTLADVNSILADEGKCCQPQMLECQESHSQSKPRSS